MLSSDFDFLAVVHMAKQFRVSSADSWSCFELSDDFVRKQANLSDAQNAQIQRRKENILPQDFGRFCIFSH